MKHSNIEIKAECCDHEKIRLILKLCGADFKGKDRQIGTHFKTNDGKLNWFDEIISQRLDQNNN